MRNDVSDNKAVTLLALHSSKKIDFINLKEFLLIKKLGFCLNMIELCLSLKIL